MNMPATTCNLPAAVVELISRSQIRVDNPVGVMSVQAAPPLATVERCKPLLLVAR